MCLRVSLFSGFICPLSDVCCACVAETYDPTTRRQLASAGCHVLRLLVQHPTLLADDPIALRIRATVTLSMATHAAPATVRLYGNDVLLALDAHMHAQTSERSPGQSSSSVGAPVPATVPGPASKVGPESD
jgi:hypothetical protein